MQITKKRLKQIISEEMERLSEMHGMEPMQNSGLGPVLDFKMIIDKYGLSKDEAMRALMAAFKPGGVMQESKKRNK